MIGARSAFSELDSGIRGTILFVGKGGEHHKLTGQSFGQDRRSILEVARKVWAPKLSYSTKTTQ